MNRLIETPQSNTGFRTQLVTVVNGSYAASPSFGSGAAVLNNYTTQTIDARAAVSHKGSLVNFTAGVTLDLSLADPAFPATEELRLRVKAPLASNEPGNYAIGLPASDPLSPQPIFTDVEVVDSTGTFAVAGQYSARLLTDGTLALVTVDTTAAPHATATIDTANLAGSFGAAAGNTLRINIRGAYRSA